jgi:hypothetical protein
MNYQFQGNILGLNYVKKPDSASLKANILKIKGGTGLEKASIDSPLTRCDLVILHRLNVCPVIAHWSHSLIVENVPKGVVAVTRKNWF